MHACIFVRVCIMPFWANADCSVIERRNSNKLVRNGMSKSAILPSHSLPRRLHFKSYKRFFSLPP